MTIGKTTDAVLNIGPLGVYDFSIDQDGDILTDDFFNTCILMSLFCERRAFVSEMPVSQYRRGWIGNESTPDFEIGSKLWLYEQARLSRSVLNGLNSVARESLKWMIEYGIALEIGATSALSQNNGITLTILITRPNSKVEKRFYDLWENTGK